MTSNSKKAKKPIYILLIEVLTNASLILMFLSVMAGVITRYILKSPLFWTDELSRYLMIYMVFLGSTLSFREGKHPSLTFIVDSMSAKTHRVWDSIIDLFLIAVLVMITAGSFDMMFSGPVGYTPSLRIKFSWVYLAIPLGGISMIAEILLRLIRRLRNKLEHSDSTTNINGNGAY